MMSQNPTLYLRLLSRDLSLQIMKLCGLAWVAFGVLKEPTGKYPVFTVLQLDIKVETHLIQLMRRFAQDRLIIMKLCKLYLTPRQFLMKHYLNFFGKVTIQHKS